MNLETICDLLTDTGAYMSADAVVILLSIASDGSVSDPEEPEEESSYAVCALSDNDDRRDALSRSTTVVAFVRHCDVEDRTLRRDVHTITTSPHVAAAAMRHLVAVHTASGVRDAGDCMILHEQSQRRLLAGYLEEVAHEIRWRGMHSLPGRLRAVSLMLDRRAGRWNQQYLQYTASNRRPLSARRSTESRSPR